MKSKLAIAFAALLLAGTASANTIRIISDSSLRTAEQARQQAVTAIVSWLQTQIAGAIEDGDFEYTKEYQYNFEQPIREVIQESFLKAGYRVTWDFNEQTKVLRLTISWR